MNLAKSLPGTGSTVQPRRDARKAGLQYVTDAQPGIVRIQKGTHFVYQNSRGKKIRDSRILHRIRSLVIPPAWTEVWICSRADGHIQATGRDDRKRKQYRYHRKWIEIRDRNKYDHMLAFGKVLPHLRRQVKRDLRLRGLPKEKIVATVIRLLETTLIRVGNDEYARDNHSYGLTTMRNRHARVGRKVIEFDFKGKSGKHHHIELADAQLARIVRQCQDLPGQDLFAYRDDQNVAHAIGSQDVNDYLREKTGQDFTAKDFRTWIGTVLAALAFHEFADVTSERQARQNVRMVVESVSKILGNTPAVCRKCYIHPEIINFYLEGKTVKAVSQKIGEKLNHDMSRLRPAEAAVLILLQKKLKQRTTPRHGNTY
jgi:DNA topoisomerase-1